MCRMRPLLGTGVVMRSETFQKGPSVREPSLSRAEDCPVRSVSPGHTMRGKGRGG